MVPTNLRDEAESDRITDAEASELRRRLGDAPNAQEAITLKDIAEASGRDIDDVRGVLRALRQERAFLVEAPRKRSQAPLLVLALVMFGVAGTIYKLQPPRPLTDEEIDRVLADAQARRAARPKKINYPVTTTLKDVVAPYGTSVEIKGKFTITKAAVPKEFTPYTVPTLTAALTRVTAETARQAQEAEDAVPAGTPEPKTDPMMANYANDPSLKSAFQVNINTPGSGTMAWIVRGMGTEDQARRIVEGLAKSAWENQNKQLAQEPKLGTFDSLPYYPGFSMSSAGRTGYSAGMASTLIAPVDPALVEKRIAQTLQMMLERDRVTNVYAATPEADRPVPEYTPVTITGPYGPEKVSMPTNVSKEYPSAVEVMRAQEGMVARLARKIGDQIRRLNREAK